jgi:hypothetical protein
MVVNNNSEVMNARQRVPTTAGKVTGKSASALASAVVGN